KPAIRVFVHTHGRLDEVMPVALLGNLKHTVLVAHRVVLPDHTLLLDAQDVGQRPHVGHEGRSVLGGLDRKARVVLRDVDARASGWPPRPRRAPPGASGAARGSGACRTAVPCARALPGSSSGCAESRAA